jgi:hypothetical protein
VLKVLEWSGELLLGFPALPAGDGGTPQTGLPALFADAWVELVAD